MIRSSCLSKSINYQSDLLEFHVPAVFAIRDPPIIPRRSLTSLYKPYASGTLNISSCTFEIVVVQHQLSRPVAFIQICNHIEASPCFSRSLDTCDHLPQDQLSCTAVGNLILFSMSFL